MREQGFEEALAAPAAAQMFGKGMAKHMCLSNKYNIGKYNIGC